MLNIYGNPLSGPDLLSAGPRSEKMCGPSTGSTDLFFLEKTGDLFSHHLPWVSCHFFLKTGDLFSHDSPIFPTYKNLPLLLWGTFLWDPCSAEHAEHVYIRPCPLFFLYDISSWQNFSYRTSERAPIESFRMCGPLIDGLVGAGTEPPI